MGLLASEIMIQMNYIRLFLNCWSFFKKVQNIRNSLKFFHYYTFSIMQGQAPVRMGQGIQEGGQGEQFQEQYDFSQCSRIKKLTTHDIFRFKHQQTPLVLKLFAAQALSNYQKEVDYLKRMTHQQVLRLLYCRTALNPISCHSLQNSHMIVMKEAIRGDLNDYLPRFGRMSEKMARTYFKEIVEGLSSAAKLKPAVVHPNLQASSILLGSKGELYICGWSELTTKEEEVLLQESVFSCGEILICMLTSFMPFYKKYSSTDAFYKFISEEHIHKFWQELQKRMVRTDKNFKFSNQLKTMIQGIFLKKITNFDGLKEEAWFKGQVYKQNQLLILLEGNERVKLQKLAVRRKQEVANQQHRKKILRELSFGPQRSSQEEVDFINDYNQHYMKEDDLPHGNCQLKVEGSPAFLVACLREFLRQQNGRASVMVREQFVLSNHKVVKINNCIEIDLLFSVSLLEQEEEEGLLQPVAADSVSLKLSLCFCRREKQVYAEMSVVESNFNSYYTNLALRFLEDKINKGKHLSRVFETLSDLNLPKK